MLYQIAYIISRNFHCDAIILVIKLFLCEALEPMAGSKCKPGQGQWALKLESCCDVIQTLFSTAMTGQDNVSAQKAFLEESGCNACRYYACDIIISSPMDCHLNVVGRFEFSMILRAMPSVVFNHFHQGHPWR